MRAGQALALTGPNGAGKSTLALLLAGLLRPTGGDGARRGRAGPAATSRGRCGGGAARDLVRRVGTVFQDPEHQFVTSTVRARAGGRAAAGRGRRGRGRARADELLDRLGLTPLAAANPFTLSGGEKRRLSVATAIATAPRMVVADEPTFGQDARTWAELVALLADLRDAGHGARPGDPRRGPRRRRWPTELRLASDERARP